MKTLYPFVFLVLMSVLWMGCPYSAEIALDEKPSIAVNNYLIGEWELREGGDYKYVITAKDNFNYGIHKVSNSNATDEQFFTAFFSKIGNDMFLNIAEDGYDTKTWYFYKFTDNGNGRITLDAVTENIDETFTSSAAMRSYFEKHAGLSFFFEKEADEYLKIK